MGNHNSGRRPQATALKVLRGNPSKTPINELEPRPPAGNVVQPDTLSPQAVAVWAEMAPGAIAMGTLTVVDVQSFATMCELEVTRRMASSQKAAEGFAPFIISADYNGTDKVQAHPAFKLERESATALRPYYEKFGLEPSGRSRIRVPKKAEEPVSKWAGVIK